MTPPGPGLLGRHEGRFHTESEAVAPADRYSGLTRTGLPPVWSAGGNIPGSWAGFMDMKSADPIPVGMVPSRTPVTDSAYHASVTKATVIVPARKPSSRLLWCMRGLPARIRATVSTQGLFYPG